MTSNKPKSLLDTLREREDDAAALKRQRKRETVEEQISRFLDGEMSADEADTLTLKHGEAIDRERVRRQETAERKKAQAEERASALWSDRIRPTPQEDAADKAAIEEFCRAHPEFKREIPTNGNQILAELRANRQVITLANLEGAYQRLKPTGIFVNKTVEEARVDKLSADQYRQEHPELADNRTPPMLVKQTEKALLTFIAEHPQYVPCEANRALMMQWLAELELPVSSGNLDAAFTALASQGLLKQNGAVMMSGATTLTDYGDKKQHGVPPQPSKYSFRKKLDSMSAAEYAERCANDPSFKASVDALE